MIVEIYGKKATFAAIINSAPLIDATSDAPSLSPGFSASTARAAAI